MSYRPVYDSRVSNEDIGAATKALAEAVSALTRSVTKNLGEVGMDVNAQVAGSLRAASEELSAASARISKAGSSSARKRSEQTRARLIEAAGKLFAERGYEAASLGDVAAEAGFTKGAVYANFASKEDLLLAVAAEVGECNRVWLAENHDNPDALRVLEASDSLKLTQVLAIEIALYAARHPELQARIVDLMGPGLSGVAELVAVSRGRDRSQPTEADQDDAMGILAIRSYVQLMAPTTADPRAWDAASRLIGRILDGR